MLVFVNTFVNWIYTFFEILFFCLLFISTLREFVYELFVLPNIVFVPVFSFGIFPSFNVRFAGNKQQVSEETNILIICLQHVKHIFKGAASVL